MSLNLLEMLSSVGLEAHAPVQDLRYAVHKGRTMVSVELPVKDLDADKHKPLPDSKQLGGGVYLRAMIILAVVVLILGVLLGGFILIPRKKSKPAQEEKSHSSAGSKALKTYTQAEVALHNKSTDCWIIIKGKVFDVTPYVEEHPGGDAILVHAGDDSTEGFFGPQHGTRVFDMIDDFYIGDLEK